MVTRPKILVVDDSPTIRKLVEIAARSTDWSVHFAESGQDGIAAARTIVPDVVLLDFVLPDMKGVDVCQRLFGDVRTAQVPVLVVTAKSETVRDLFRPFPNFAGWIAKPFTADEIVSRVQRVLAERAGSRERSTSLGLSRERKEQAAKALYAALKQPLADVPSWLAQLGAAPAAPFLAKKILTPAMIEALLEALAPIYRELLGATPAVTKPSEASFSGTLQGWPLGDLLLLIGGSGRSGVLTLTVKERVTLLYCRAGELILVTTKDPVAYQAGSTLPLDGTPPAALAEAEAEQRTSGKPVYVGLAERGALPKPCDLGATLHHHSKRLLLAALAEKNVEFAWRDLAALPPYADAYGRHVSAARETLVGVPQAASAGSLSQMTLDRLRQAGEAHDVPAGVAFDRVKGFSQKVKELSLSTDERKLLALVDGHTPAEQLALRSGLPNGDAGSILHRLSEVGLIRARSATSVARAAQAADRQGSVLIVDSDVEGFHTPLRSLLSNREEPLDLVAIDEEPDVVEAIRRERPRMVILNAELGGDTLASTARAVREMQDLCHVSLVAVLEASAESERAGLAAAGFDAVLVKPVAYAELERLINA